MSKKSAKLRKESESRRSYRRFVPTEINQSTIEDWIMTASSAPSGANKQPWFFCVVTDEVLKKEIRKQAEEIEKSFYKDRISDSWRADLAHLKTDWEKPFLTEAACLIVVFKEAYKILDDGERDKNYYPMESVGLALGMLINAIRHSGYESLTYTPAPMTFLNQLFKRPEGQSAVMIVAVGKGNEAYELPNLKKKELKEVAQFYTS